MTVVKVEQGLLEGVKCGGDQGYLAFKGIPYAKPPIGKLRFKAPQPPEPWEGVRDASQHDAICPQYNDRLQALEEGDEDCLFLNVYTPDTSGDPRPVMVWIHGGAFYTGSGDSKYYGPELFIDQNVILVTINYRLEVLGFLSLDLDEVPGNAGLKDQVAALKWVKNNISAFGGDANNVTIFGCSAGAASCSYHLVSDMSKGLFDKAICQSGVCINDWAYGLYGNNRAFQLGKFLGKDTEDPKELLDFLMSVPASSLVNLKLPPLNAKYDMSDSILFGPVIENPDLPGEHFITEPPPDLVKRGRIADVPMILGHTSGEGIEIAKNYPQIGQFLETSGALLPRELKLKWPPEMVKEVDESIRSHYFKNGHITPQSMQSLVDLYTDSFFTYNIRRFGRYAAMQNTSPVYLYNFTADTERNFMKKRYGMEELVGVCHADEVHYLFLESYLNLPEPMSKEAAFVAEQIVAMWTNFARTGNPSIPDQEEWKPFTDSEQNCYIIDVSPKCEVNVHKNTPFWDEIYGEEDISRQL